MTLTPSNREELAAALRAASRDGRPVPRTEVSRLNRICRYAPEDLTVTVEAGLTLGALQAELGRHGQWLPLDPPGAESWPIGSILDADLSGPRRHGHGTIREHLIGLHVALADGRIVRSGGQVVKNVAGFDLMKLFVGAQGSLGVIVEAAFKLLPRPAREAFVQFPCRSWEEMTEMLERVQESPITPVVFDLHKLTRANGMMASMVLGFAGTEEEVAWQLDEARAIGAYAPATLAYATEFIGGDLQTVRKESVLPSRLVEILQRIAPAPFVARAGLGIVYHRQPAVVPPALVPSSWLRRVKEAFDPRSLFPQAPGL